MLYHSPSNPRIYFYWTPNYDKKCQVTAATLFSGPVFCDKNCIATLLQAEADVYVKDKNDVTSLHILAQGTVG